MEMNQIYNFNGNPQLPGSGYPLLSTRRSGWQRNPRFVEKNLLILQNHGMIL